MKLKLDRNEKNGRLIANLNKMTGKEIPADVLPFVENDKWKQTFNHLYDNDFNTRVFYHLPGDAEKVIREAVKNYRKIVCSLSSPLNPKTIFDGTGANFVKEFSDNDRLEVISDHTFNVSGDILITNSASINVTNRAKYPHHSRVLELASLYSFPLTSINSYSSNSFADRTREFVWRSVKSNLPREAIASNCIADFEAFMSVAGYSIHLIKDVLDGLPFIHSVNVKAQGSYEQRFDAAIANPIRRGHFAAAINTATRNYKKVATLRVSDTFPKSENLLDFQSIKELRSYIRGEPQKTHTVIIGSAFFSMAEWDMLNELKQTHVDMEMFIFAGDSELEFLYQSSLP